MTQLKEKLKKIKAFIFDIDGVLSCDTQQLDVDGVPIRTTNVKDGYAIHNAINMGYQVAIITGGFSKNVPLRYKRLSVPPDNIYIDVQDKITPFNDFLKRTNLKKEEILYMGDDLIDHKILSEVGFPVCPADAVDEIKEISLYITKKNGGKGCAREVIEMVMKAHNKWININSYYWRSE
ncbi:MAG: HAD hydrolase family protein [Prolixibacteraceae bacterium]|nr:HAD hydrolase family protein [Prolixibacteraceae bacterium]